MIGNLDIAFDIFLAGGHVGKDRRQQIVRMNTQNLRWHFSSIAEAQQRQRASGVPSPARLEDRRRKRGLLQHLLHALLAQKLEDLFQWEAVLLSQSDVESVLRCRRLQFEVEGAAEALAQRQSPGF